MNANKSAEVVVEVGIMPQLRRAPRGELEECLDDKGSFAPRRNYDTVRWAVRALAAEFLADFAVNFGSDEDAAPRFLREIGKAGEAAGVVRLGQGEAAEGGLVDVFGRRADGGG